MASTSYEPRRTRPYSEDLRWRMIWQLESQDQAGSIQPRSAVSRVVSQFQITGKVNNKLESRSTVYNVLTEPIQFILIHLVLSRPGIYLHEIASAILEQTGADISLACICRFMKKMRFSRQRLKITARQRDNFLRSSYVLEVSIYHEDMFIFLDETGSDKRASIRKYGYSLRGRPLTCEKLLVRGKRVSAIAIMSTVGILDCKTVIGSVDGSIFYNFVQTNLLPHLLPFNGSNPHSIVVMDNCSIHHVQGIAKMIQEVGAFVIFLPPYSPDYNPIGGIFKSKSES